ncbi:hypothetical protein AB0M44_08315 [Streptosporangium subroseum]|uniref:hypothetical protein n=1 Tax=Streptosporangium subroseum TaxID=106412 RepID=UPI0034350BFA
MTSRDALRAGEAIPLDSQWPGLKGDPTPKQFKSSALRAVATDLELYLGPMTGAANSEGYTTGSINSIRENCNLTEAQLGQWDTASAFTQSAGANCGKTFEEAYGEFIAAYEAVIRVIRENAKVLDGTEDDNEG